MLTIKDEISSYLQLTLLPEYPELDTFTPEDVFEIRDGIISMFEKLIDKEIHHIQYNYSSVNDTFQAGEKRTAQVKVLNKLKMELEK